MNQRDLEDLCELLNATNPALSLEEYLQVQHWSKRREKAFRRRFTELQKKAQEQRIPLGLALGNCRNYEDAYILRQRFLTRILNEEDSFQTISSVALLLILGLTFIILTLIFT